VVASCVRTSQRRLRHQHGLAQIRTASSLAAGSSPSPLKSAGDDERACGEKRTAAMVHHPHLRRVRPPRHRHPPATAQRSVLPASEESPTAATIAAVAAAGTYSRIPSVHRWTHPASPWGTRAVRKAANVLGHGGRREGGSTDARTE
jgi:hypothetical protein